MTVDGHKNNEEDLLMITFENGEVPDDEVVDVQGKGEMPARDVPEDRFCWRPAVKTGPKDRPKSLGRRLK